MSWLTDIFTDCRNINTAGVIALGRVLDAQELCKALEWAAIDLPCPAQPLPDVARLALDMKVMCEIACCCQKNPNIAKDGSRRYQNCVADTLRNARSFTGGRTPYHPEVGYRMTSEPVLRPVPRNDRPPDYPGEGTVRVDVVSVVDSGKPPAPDNIFRIYEMKFPGDPANQDQLDTYEKIEPTVLIDVDAECDCDDDNDGERVKVLAAVESYQRSKEQQRIDETNRGALEAFLLRRLPLPRRIPRPAPSPRPVPAG
jgi:hypothetical protein